MFQALNHSNISPLGNIQTGLYWQPSKFAILVSSSCVNFPVFNLPESVDWATPNLLANSVKVIPEASQDSKTLFLIERIISPPLLFCDYSNTLLWTFQGTKLSLGTRLSDLTVSEKNSIIILVRDSYTIFSKFPVLSFRSIQGFLLPCTSILAHF